MPGRRTCPRMVCLEEVRQWSLVFSLPFLLIPLFFPSLKMTLPAGDWGLQSPQYVESGAVYLSGTLNITLDNCIWKYLDGNGVFIAGYNRNTTITNSELTQIGDSAIALWGYTEGADPLQPPGTGIDGSKGLQPRYVDITRNLCHEIGYHQKQSSCVFIAKSMFVNILEMVAYNGPRAHVNQNDGMGMGHVMARNVMWSSCRESSDHGGVLSIPPSSRCLVCPTAAHFLSAFPKHRSLQFVESESILSRDFA